MDRAVATRKLVAELVDGRHIEVRRAEILVRDLVKLLDTLKRAPSGHELEDWLDEHAQVTELYASRTLLDELVERYFAPPPIDPANLVEARNPDLEREIRATPDSREPYLVYADWLQEHSDPLGELIALGVAGDSERFDRLLDRYESHFLGGMKRQLTSCVELRWRNGFVQAIEQLIEPLEPAAWERLLHLRVCELVESITLRQACTPQLDETIATHAPASLRELTLQNGPFPERLLQRDLRSLVVTAGTITLDAAQLPASLERLDLRVYALDVTGSLARIPIRELHLGSLGGLYEGMSGIELPRLERLTIGNVRSVPGVAGLLESMSLPALRHLGISDGLIDEETFGHLARTAVVKQLTSLAITNFAIKDATMQKIAGYRGFALAELDVSNNELSREGLEAARNLATKVISRRQFKPGSGMAMRVRQFAGSRIQPAMAIADPKSWRRAGIDGDIRWARYRGESEYELFVSIDLERYGCSCPSSFQPCKHVVALALVAEQTELPEAPSEGIEARLGITA